MLLFVFVKMEVEILLFKIKTNNKKEWGFI